jgi:hypothetical protein
MKNARFMNVVDVENDSTKYKGLRVEVRNKWIRINGFA